MSHYTTFLSLTRVQKTKKRLHKRKQIGMENQTITSYAKPAVQGVKSQCQQKAFSPSLSCEDFLYEMDDDHSHPVRQLFEIDKESKKSKCLVNSECRRHVKPMAGYSTVH